MIFCRLNLLRDKKLASIRWHFPNNRQTVLRVLEVLSFDFLKWISSHWKVSRTSPTFRRCWTSRRKFLEMESVSQKVLSRARPQVEVIEVANNFRPSLSSFQTRKLADNARDKLFLFWHATLPSLWEFSWVLARDFHRESFQDKIRILAMSSVDSLEGKSLGELWWSRWWKF